MRSITTQAMTNNYDGGQSRDQKSTINYHQGQQWCHWSLMGELAIKTRPGSRGIVHTMDGGGRSERIRGIREVCCHEVAECAVMLAGQSLANKQHPHVAAECAGALGALVLAGEQRHHEVAELLRCQWQASEVALCPLLPWYCVKSSWNVWFRYYQHVFYLEKVIFHLGYNFFKLISFSF